MRQLRTRGDTLVEIMLAITIFSLAAVSALVVMNKGIAMSQHGLEVTLVREQIDGQAEMIRYLRDTSSSLWDTIKAHADNTTVAPLSPGTCPTSSSLADPSSRMHGFFVVRDASSDIFVVQDVDAAHFSMPPTYAKIDYEAQHAHGLWVQAARAENISSNSIDAYDMYIHACWDSVSMNGVPATLGTIVRIYDK